MSSERDNPMADQARSFRRVLGVFGAGIVLASIAVVADCHQEGSNINHQDKDSEFYDPICKKAVLGQDGTSIQKLIELTPNEIQQLPFPLPQDVVCLRIGKVGTIRPVNSDNIR